MCSFLLFVSELDIYTCHPSPSFGMLACSAHSSRPDYTTSPRLHKIGNTIHSHTLLTCINLLSASLCPAPALFPLPPPLPTPSQAEISWDNDDPFCILCKPNLRSFATWTLIQYGFYGWLLQHWFAVSLWNTYERFEKTLHSAPAAHFFIYLSL